MRALVRAVLVVGWGLDCVPVVGAGFLVGIVVCVNYLWVLCLCLLIVIGVVPVWWRIGLVGLVVGVEGFLSCWKGT